MSRASDDLAFRDWVERARAVATLEAAERVGFRPAKGHEKGSERAGPCPSCGGTDRFALLVQGPRKGLFNCRGCGIAGKDGVGLVMAVQQIGFLEACEFVAGPRPGLAASPVPGAPARPTAALAESEGREAWVAGVKDCPYGPDEPALLDAWMRGHLKAAEEDRKDRERREGERGRAHAIWREGAPIAGSPAAAYLMARGLGQMLAFPLRLRCHPSLPYWHDSREIGAAPAMLAAMVRNDGVFAGVHITWLDPPGDRKAVFEDAATGEILPAKKMRGQKRGCHIELLRPEGDAERLVIGEGIENVLSAALMMRGGALWPKTTWWTSCDLGNLGGPSFGSTPHPFRRIERTRRDGSSYNSPMTVPGPEPAERSDWPAIAPPVSAREIVVLGDGDSDAFATRNVVERARRRWTAAGFAVRPVFADDGMDFNDMWRARLAEGAAA
jgi:hypothetical protein